MKRSLKVTLYAFAKDAAGNVSAAASASTTISAGGGDDDTGSGDDGSETGGGSGGTTGSSTGGEVGDDSASTAAGQPRGEAGSGTESRVSMSAWDSRWFSVTIQNQAESAGVSNGYLTIQSWNSDASTLQATLFTPDAQGNWASTIPMCRFRFCIRENASLMAMGWRVGATHCTQL
jgi:hypothetical protein